MKKRIFIFMLNCMLVSIGVTNAQVTIGSGDAPDASAILELKTAANNKGFLGPRVSLTSPTDQATIPSPAEGLLVYNMGDAGLTFAGYVYWNGTEWRTLSGGSLAPGTIGSITCNDVTMTPSIYEAGVPFEGTMIVPYTGSNGGVYEEQILGPVNGLTATLAAGNFEPGAGSLAYHITGTPTVTTPEITTFSINIGGQTCEASIGAGDGIAPGDLVFYKTPEIPASVVGSGTSTGGNQDIGWMSYYANDLPVVGGKLRLDGYFNAAVSGTGSVSFNPRLVNVSDQNVKFWFSAMTTVDNFNTANIVLGPGTFVNLDNGIYNGYGSNNTLANPTVTTGGTSVQQNYTEVVTLDLSLDDKWYRIYYYPIIDNKEQTTAANMVRKIYVSIQRLY